MKTQLDEIINAVKEMDAQELEQLLDVAQARYADVSSASASPVLQGDIPEGAEGALPPVEALEDADMDYDKEMAGVTAGPPEMEEDEDMDFPPVPRR